MTISNIIKRGQYEPFVSFNGVKVDVSLIVDRSITLEEYNAVSANTLGYQSLLPKVNDETLEYIAFYHMGNCRWDSDVTYDGNLKLNVLPELLKRMQEYRIFREQ